MRKRWTLLSANEDEVILLQEALDIHPVFCRLLVQRGIKTFDEAKAFFRPDFSQMHDPFLMKNMDKAVARLDHAMLNDERILLYGDYDVDGTTSVAMMYSFLIKHYSNIDYYIPDRDKEGYGVSLAGVEYAKVHGISLMIAMDCGIQAVKQVAQAKAFNIDFIICDHHLPGDELPDAAAILDPKQHDCNYPFKELSGCGVAFKLIHAFLRKKNLPENELDDLLDLLTLSIAADIVPITGENRMLAYHGLAKLNGCDRIGIKALIEKSGRKPPLTISDLVFGMAPLINAAGRLADADQAVKLLISTDDHAAYQDARVLGQRNELRKNHDQSIVREAKSLFQATPEWETLRSIVLFQKDWHKGVVGIAAARMVEHFHRPTILLTESNGLAVGSARTVAGFNIYKAIKSCEDLLLNFGGHDHAAGLTLGINNVPEFRDRFETFVKENITDDELTPEIKISAVLDLQDITPSFWRILKQFSPFGPGNRNPVFATKNVVDTGYSRILKGNHLRIAVKQGNSPPMYGIAFDRGEDFPKISRKKPFHIAYKLEEDNWQGRAQLRMVIKDFWF